MIDFDAGFAIRGGREVHAELNVLTKGLIVLPVRNVHGEFAMAGRTEIQLHVEPAHRPLLGTEILVINLRIRDVDIWINGRRDSIDICCVGGCAESTLSPASMMSLGQFADVSSQLSPFLER